MIKGMDEPVDTYFFLVLAGFTFIFFALFFSSLNNFTIFPFEIALD